MLFIAIAAVTPERLSETLLAENFSECPDCFLNSRGTSIAPASDQPKLQFPGNYPRDVQQVFGQLELGCGVSINVGDIWNHCPIKNDGIYSKFHMDSRASSLAQLQPVDSRFPHKWLSAGEYFDSIATARLLRFALPVHADVVLLDIGLPKLDRYEAARQIRHQGWCSEIRLVALTGWGNDDDTCRARDAGFDNHLTKPVVFEKLDALLAEVAN